MIHQQRPYSRLSPQAVLAQRAAQPRLHDRPAWLSQKILVEKMSRPFALTQ